MSLPIDADHNKPVEGATISLHGETWIIVRTNLPHPYWLNYPNGWLLPDNNWPKPKTFAGSAAPTMNRLMIIPLRLAHHTYQPNQVYGEYSP